jgi:orotidine-5'-phosphate decarboxylase
MSDGPSHRIPFVLTSKDPSFGGLLEHLCHESSLHLLTTAGPSITLETVRSNAPVFVLLDLDSIDAQEACRLISKLGLVSHAFVLLTGVNAVPGLTSMDPFFHAGASGSLIKPDGKTSLSLAGESAQSFLKQLRALVSRLQTRRLA